MNNEKEQYWIPDKFDEQKGLCTLNDPGKRFRVYAKWDESLHFWFYENDYSFDCDTGEKLSGTNHYDYYWDIGGLEELDDFILRLQALKEDATTWFASRGKLWPPDWEGYIKGDLTIEQATTLPEKKKPEKKKPNKKEDWEIAEIAFDKEFYEGLYCLAESDGEFYPCEEDVKTFIRDLLTKK